MAECAAIMKADIPAETVSRKGMCQSTDCLRLLKQQDFVIQPRKRSGRRHATHARANDNDIELIC
jgi:hypothetical protein